MRKKIKDLVKKWDDFRNKISSDYYYKFDAKDRKRYCSLMAKTFPVLREELQNDTVNKDICFLFAALGAFGVDGVDDGEGNCMKGEMYVDIASFHECFMKALKNDLVFDENGFLIVPNMYHNAEYDETPEFHVDTTCFDGIEEKAIEWIPPEQDISRFETMTFGPYEWLILDRSEDRVLLLSKEAVSVQPFEANETRKDAEVTYLNSSLREWLNLSFINEFSEEEKRLIIPTDLSDKDAEVSQDNKPKDLFFLLSKDEVLKLMPLENERITDVSKLSELSNAPIMCWWLRSLHTTEVFAGYSLKLGDAVWPGTGVITGASFSIKEAVRPAVWIKNTSK